MSKHLDHEKSNRRVTNEDVVAAKDRRVSTTKLVQANDNLVQRGWLQELLTLPELTDYQRDLIQKSLRWLEEISTRRMSPGWKKAFQDIEFVCGLKRRGTFVPPSEEKKAQARRRTVLRAIRREETRPKIQNWMQDRSLLPKKPPTRSE